MFYSCGCCASLWVITSALRTEDIVESEPILAASDDRETAQADREVKHLKKTLGRLDIVFLIVAAVVSIETLGQVSGFGAETFTWALVLAVLFLVPYGLIFAETGAAFTGEGGVYVWCRKAFGRPVAAIASLLTWVTQPVWVGGSMAFIASESWSTYVTPFEHGSVIDYAFKLVFIWLTVLAAIISLRHGKWIPNIGAILKIAFLAIFLVTAAIYATRHGVAGLSVSDFSPTVGGLLGVTPLLLFSYLGFESGNSAAGEMKNPARDVPIAIARSAGIAAAAYLLPIFAILVVLPADDITGIGGLMEAVAKVFSVYGAAAPAMLTVTGVIFAVILMTQGSAWMIISDRMQAMAAADGAFFGGFFGRFHPQLGTPVRVNLLSGAVATVFCLVAMQVTGSSAAIFGVVLSVSISTFLLSYVISIPAAVRLRTRFLTCPGRSGYRPATPGSASSAGCASRGWHSVPGSRSFPARWSACSGSTTTSLRPGVSARLTFELFTLGTLAVLGILGAVGYLRARPVRAERPGHRTAGGH